MSKARVVSMYLDYAENQAARQIPMRMTDWVTKLDAFLTFNEYDILKDAARAPDGRSSSLFCASDYPKTASHFSVRCSKVSHAVAKALAEKAYDSFRVEQDQAFESDFEREATRVIASASPSKKPKKDKT